MVECVQYQIIDLDSIYEILVPLLIPSCKDWFWIDLKAKAWFQGLKSGTKFLNCGKTLNL